MDTPVQQATTQNSTQLNHRDILKNTKMGLGGIGLGIICFFVFLLVLNYFNILQLEKTIPFLSFLPHRPTIVISPDEKKAIAKIGDETIYQRDLNLEKARYGGKEDAQIRKQILEKIIIDSIVLQAGRKENLVSLDRSIYNSVYKDNIKRTKAIREVRKQLEAQADGISGAVISIWFVDNATNTPGKLGLERSKQLALSKITPLYEDVKNGKITIQQAAEKIRTDKSLLELDKSYHTNAILGFRATKARPQIVYKEFDDILWSLKKGEVSQIITGGIIDVNTGKKVKDMYYAFGQVLDTINTGKVISYNDWINQQKGQYAVTYY